MVRRSYSFDPLLSGARFGLNDRTVARLMSASHLFLWKAERMRGALVHLGDPTLVHVDSPLEKCSDARASGGF